MTKTFYVRLSEKELLDAYTLGILTSKDAIDKASKIIRVISLQKGNAPEDRFIASIIELAQRELALSFSRTELSSCPICGENKAYHKYTSATKYHKKGENNLDRPIYLRGIDLEKSFVKFKGSAKYGCCTECYEKIQPKLIEQLKDVKAEIPEQITGQKPKWEKTNWVSCNTCDWQGWETELGLLPTLMASGSYYGQCPKCQGKSSPLSFRSQFTYDYKKVTVVERVERK